MNKCNQNNCIQIATFYVYWPGIDPAPMMCFEHAQKAKQIGNIMGFPIVIKPMSENELLNEIS